MKSGDNKTIAKNTGFMFIRMILVLIITLYSSRIILESLGIDDFGIYSVVAGFISMLSFLSGSMANCTQRFYNFSLGKDDDEELRHVIKISFSVQIIILGIILLTAETLGMWFVDNKLNFPGGVTLQIHLLYQFAIFNFLIKVIQAPYKGMVMAKEKMNVIASISVIEAFLLLGVAFIIKCFPAGQKVWLYAASISIVYLGILFSYIYFSKKVCSLMKISFSFNLAKIKEMTSFAGWNIFGQVAGVIKNQGINVLLNIFFSVIINTARGLSYQLLAGVIQITNNINVAIQPQIVQSYASGNMKRYMSLMYFGCKSNYLLLWLITLPILFCTRSLLNIWLGKDYPKITEIFVVLVLLNSVVDAFAPTVATGIYAYGKIRNYQIWVSAIVMLTLPISYIFLKLGYGPTAPFFISIIVSIFAMGARIYFWRKVVYFSIRNFFTVTIVPCILTTIISFLFMSLIMKYVEFNNMYIKVLITTLISLAINVPIIYFIGLSPSEKNRVIRGINIFINKIHNV